MYKNWKESTAFFVLQIIAGTVLWTFLGGNFSLTLAVVALLSFLLLVSSFVTAFGIMISIAAIALFSPLLAAIIGIAVLWVIAGRLAVVEAQKNDSKEPKWAVAITYMSMGVGTIVGGLLLLYFHFLTKDKQKNISA